VEKFRDTGFVKEVSREEGLILAQLQNLNEMPTYGYKFCIQALAINRKSP
jgi:hypothetical protein